jgi:hypothetical protein
LNSLVLGKSRSASTHRTSDVANVIMNRLSGHKGTLADWYVEFVLYCVDHISSNLDNSTHLPSLDRIHPPCDMNAILDSLALEPFHIFFDF